MFDNSFYPCMCNVFQMSIGSAKTIVGNLVNIAKGNAKVICQGSSTGASRIVTQRGMLASMHAKTECQFIVVRALG